MKIYCIAYCTPPVGFNLALAGRTFMLPEWIFPELQATLNIIYRKTLFFKMKYAINRKKGFLFDEKYKRN